MKALEFMAHGKGTDDPSSSLFTKRHQVSERHSGALKSFPLGAGGHTSQQLQRLALETHVLHSQAHSIRAGGVNPWSRTIQVRPDGRHELSTRLTEPVNYRPRRHLFGYRHERAASGFQVGDHSFLSLSSHSYSPYCCDRKLFTFWCVRVCGASRACDLSYQRV